MKSKQLNRNLYIIISTLVLFAVGYYLYLEVFARNKEDHIIATKSRILEQMSKNLKVKVSSMGTNTKEYASYLLDLSKNKTYKSPEDSLTKLLQQRKDIQFYNGNLEYVISEKSQISLPTDSNINIITNAEADFLNFNLILGDKYKKYKKKKIQFKTSYDALLNDFMPHDIFSDYILIVDQSIVYSTLHCNPNLAIIAGGSGQAKGDESGTAKVTSPGNIEFSIQSKIEQAAIRGVTTYDISISNNPYKMFICQMQVEKSNWYLCGLVDSELINQAKKGMAPWVFILVFMILSLIILGLPFIKLKVMSASEQFTSGTLINSGISLFFGTCFIILFIFFGTNAFWYRNQNETRLIDLSEEISKSLNLEIERAWKQLVVYDNTIGLKDKIRGRHLPEIANVLMKDSVRPDSYSYFDYVFWIDSNGMQKGELTPFLKVDKPADFSSRAYFQKPDEWMLPDNKTGRFRMESIVSKTSGIVKAAISKRSEIKNMVIAMTGRFYSVIEPILPSDYKFCIIDKDGLVWFHSDKLRNLQENFITECSEDKSISAAIYANATRTLEVNYYDESYRIHIEPLDPMPLYLVTMYDKQAEHAYQVQSLMLTLLLLSALVMYIILEILILYLLKPIGRKLGWKNLIVDYIGVKAEHGHIYIVMSILFVFVTFVYLLLTNPLNILNPLLFVLVMVSYILPYLKYALNEFSLKSKGRNLFATVNAVFIILINITSLRFLSDSDFYKLMIFQGVIIVLFVSSFFILKRNFTLKFASRNIALYACLLLCLLLVFSAAPSIKFFQASVNYEIVRGIKHDQMNLARQRESRNNQLRNYYKLIDQNTNLAPCIDSVYRKRMEQGVYTKFDKTEYCFQGRLCWKELDKNCKDFITKNKVKVNETEEYILNFIRPIYNRTSVETKYLESDSLMKGVQKWSLCENSLIFDYLSAAEEFAIQKPDSCRIITYLQRPPIFNPAATNQQVNKGSLFQKYNIIFILFLLAIFTIVYFLILFGARRLLGIAILEMHTPYNFLNFLSERIASGHSVMIIGSPFINLSEYIAQELKVKFKVNSLDLAKSQEMITSKKHTGKNEVLIIENFAFDYYSQTSLLLHINAINEKLSQKEKMVIIGINSPYVIQEYLEQKVNTNAAVKVKDKPDGPVENWVQTLLSFNNILANVNVLYASEKFDLTINHAECYSKSECEHILKDYTGNMDVDLRCLICRELAVSTYLHRDTKEMLNFYDKLVEMNVPDKIKKDRIIARIMDLSRLYYDNILASCTTIERFVLGDMAQDMIANSKNKKAVNILIHRGLFVVNGCSIRFMNESFRNHVLLRFTSDERARLKAQLGDSGSGWQGYKLFLVLIMIGLFSFLFIANRALLDNLNKLFIVLGGGTVLLTNLTGLLTRKENSDTK